MSKKLLDMQNGAAVASLGQRYLDDAQSALPRVHHPEDSEGLHDFRVSLRRLRSCLRSYRPELKGCFDKKLYRQLGDLARRTNLARDTEVTLAWLEQEMNSLSGSQKEGAQWWRDQLTLQWQTAYSALEGHLDEEFKALAKGMKGWFKAIKRCRERDSGFAQSTADKLEQLVDDLTLLLTVIHNLGDMATVHEARIIGKRLRYLLSPVAKSCKECRTLINDLREFQELLGGLSDCDVRARALQAAAEQAAAVWAGENMQAFALSGTKVGTCPQLNGLMTIARRNHQQAEALFRRFEHEYLRDNAATLAVLIEACIQALRKG